jgi:sec-independent protein translocase protein TatB
VFGIGLPEVVVILVVAILVFGPDRLPEFARQAGRFVRQVRQFTQAARDDLRSELGPEFADLELSDLDPRQLVRKHILDAIDDDPDEDAGTVPMRPGLRPLDRGERPPYDGEAT